MKLYVVGFKTSKIKNSTFLDCLHDLFGKTLEDNNLNCTLPWVESMKGSNMNYSEEENPTCKTSDEYDFVDTIGSDFAIDASSFSHLKCLGMNDNREDLRILCIYLI